MGTEFVITRYKAGRTVVLDKLTDAIIYTEYLTPREGRTICHIAWLMSATPEDEAMFDEIFDYFNELLQKENTIDI